MAVDLYGMIGQMPRLRAPSRFALASYPLSVMEKPLSGIQPILTTYGKSVPSSALPFTKVP